MVWKPLVVAMVGIWYKNCEIYCRPPILATRPQGPIRPLVGSNPEMGVPNMRLGVGEPLLGVGQGVGARWSGVAPCGAVSGIWPISPEISCRTPILATHLQGPIRPLVGPNP
jgi:hypothetical protein